MQHATRKDAVLGPWCGGTDGFFLYSSCARCDCRYRFRAVLRRWLCWRAAVVTLDTTNWLLLLGGCMSCFAAGWTVGRWIKAVRQFLDQV